MRDAINGHDRRIKKNRRAAAAAAKVAGVTTPRKGGANVTLTSLTPRLVGNDNGINDNASNMLVSATDIGSTSSVDKLVNITKHKK